MTEKIRYEVGDEVLGRRGDVWDEGIETRGRGMMDAGWGEENEEEGVRAEI